jgi:CheY-like chemotaxis protein
MGPDDAPRTQPNGDALDSGPRPFAWTGTGDVLIADDEPTVRNLTARALQRLGLTPVGCENGATAIAAFTEDPDRWRLVVLDLTMPVMGGAEALAAMRVLRHEIPAVISSGYSEDELARRVSDRNGIAFLQKPFTVRTLAEAVRVALGAPA